MGILKQIADRLPARRGRASDPVAAVGANIAAIDEALAEIEISRTEANKTLADGEARKRELLLEDAGIDALDLHDRTIREAQYNLDALALWEARQRGIRADLLKSRDGMVATSLRAEWQVAAEAALIALRAADAARAHCIAKNQAMRLAGFEALANQVSPPPQMLAYELIDQWEREVRPSAPARTTAAPPAPRPMPRIAGKAPPWQQREPMPKPPRPVLGDQPEGAIKVVVLRAGLEMNGAQYLAGEEAWMQPEAANAACLAGGVEIVA